MSEVVKSKIHQLLATIDDESILVQVMEDVMFYASKDETVESLSPRQLNELDLAIAEVEKNETITLDEFKKDLDEWRKE